jgi:hypothetical protein
LDGTSRWGETLAGSAASVEAAKETELAAIDDDEPNVISPLLDPLTPDESGPGDKAGG